MGVCSAYVCKYEIARRRGREQTSASMSIRRCAQMQIAVGFWFDRLAHIR